jgi:acyl-CoA synthetase (AMP-forming)/AMP-acid ligase II
MGELDQSELIITEVLATHSKWRGNKPALICEDKQLTWREFGQRINKVANGLIAGGLKKGDRVGFLISNRIDVPEIIFGAIKAGGVIVPLSTMLPGDAQARMIIDSECKFLFVGSEYRDMISPYRGDLKSIANGGFIQVGGEAKDWVSYDRFLQQSSDREPNVRLTYQDGFNIMYTSGTTGVPKGIFHTHHNRLVFALFALDFRMDSSCVSVASTALYTNGTWLMLLPVLFSGGTVVIMPKFDPQAFLGVVQKHKATHTLMVPTQFIVLLEQPNLGQFDLSSMRVWVFGAAPLQKEIKEEIHRRFSGEAIELYGCTEGIATMLKPEVREGKIGSVGIPSLNWDVRIIDDQGHELPKGEIGEIAAYSSFMMPGYYKLPDKTAEVIWKDERGRTYLKTGDMGKLDEDGFLYIVDRKKDMIISGGVNVFANDIEGVLLKHPKVKDATVIAVPHHKWGEVPLALVVPKDKSPALEEEIKEWANQRLGKYQRLSGVEFMDQFPRNALGKVLKRELRDPYWQK